MVIGWLLFGGWSGVVCFRLDVGFSLFWWVLCDYTIMLVGLLEFAVGLCFFCLLSWDVMM